MSERESGRRDSREASPTRKRERDDDDRRPSPAPKRTRSSRSRSRSPRRSSPPRSSGPGRFARETPEANKCLGMFGLPPSTEEQYIRDMCEACDGFDHIDFIYDRQTNKMKGFCFVYFKTVEDASRAKERLHGKDVEGRPIRVDFSVTKKAHSPTPGVYMGSRVAARGGYDRPYDRRDDRRSPPRRDYDRRSPSRRDYDRRSPPRRDYDRRSPPRRDYRDDRDRDRDRYDDRRRSRSRSRDRYRR